METQNNKKRNIALGCHNEFGKVPFVESSLVRAAIYVRASLNQDGDPISQLEDCKNYIQQKGWIGCDLFLERLSEEVGANRPMFSLLLERVKSGCFEAIVVPKIDLLCFGNLPFAEVRRFLAEHNVTIYSVTEPEEANVNEC